MFSLIINVLFTAIISPFTRSRNDIRKLKSELQYSEKRRLHAEEQEELSSRERAQLRDELTALRTHNNDLMTVCIVVEFSSIDGVVTMFINECFFLACNQAIVGIGCLYCYHIYVNRWRYNYVYQL